MQRTWLFALLACFGSSSAQAPPALEGAYRVPGDCAFRTDDGDYENCVTWNTLTLDPSGPDQYRYALLTNTFATTQGGCESAGTLQVQHEAGRMLLHGTDAEKPACEITLQVTDTGIDLIQPAPEANGCQQSCSSNSSLYTSAFPRDSRRTLTGYAAATAAGEAGQDVSFLDAWPHPAYQACLDGAGDDAGARNACGERELSDQDARLNRLYRALQQKLPASSRHRLRDQERDWVKQTETTCRRGSAALAAMDGLDAQACRRNRTTNRADELQALLDEAHD